MSGTTKSKDSITIRIGYLKKELEAIAIKEHTSMSKIIVDLLEKFIQKNEPQKGNNFLSKYRGVNQSTPEETKDFIEMIKSKTSIKTRF